MDGEIPCCVGCHTNSRVKKRYGIYRVLAADSRQCGQVADQLSTHSIVTSTADWPLSILVWLAYFIYLRMSSNLPRTSSTCYSSLYLIVCSITHQVLRSDNLSATEPLTAFTQLLPSVNCAQWNLSCTFKASKLSCNLCGITESDGVGPCGALRSTLQYTLICTAPLSIMPWNVFTSNFGTSSRFANFHSKISV